MFENVAELEKEIETFRENVIASSELVSGISNLTAAIQQQHLDYTKRSEEILKKLDDSVEQFNTDHNKAVDLLNKGNAAALSDLEATFKTEQQLRIEELSNIQNQLKGALQDSATKIDNAIVKFSQEHNTALESFASESAAMRQSSMDVMAKMGETGDRIVSDAQKSLNDSQQRYLAYLQETEAVIKGYQSEVEIKYNEFLNKMDSVNVEQLLVELQCVKASINSKLTIALCGIGASIIIGIIGLVL